MIRTLLWLYAVSIVVYAVRLMQNQYPRQRETHAWEDVVGMLVNGVFLYWAWVSLP